MSKLNIRLKPVPVFNHEGSRQRKQSDYENLRRAVLSCLLWEDQFYENGQTIADRIKDLVAKVAPDKVADLAVEARTQAHLRHVPLLLARELARHDKSRPIVAELLPKIVNRPDELSEFLALYFMEGKIPVANAVKKGLGDAFRKFGEHGLAKYNRDAKVTLRDVMRLCHPKPDSKEQAELWRKLIKDELETPITWETQLSASKGVNKKGVWENLLKENKLGALALLRNLRNMLEERVDINLIRTALQKCNPEQVLPFRFISAARYAPQLEAELETLMFKCLGNFGKIKGETILMIDASGSMSNRVSAKSDLTRFDAACALAILAREICEHVTVYTFANSEKLIASRRGFALRDALRANFGGGTMLKRSTQAINAKHNYDLLIAMTDEESQDGTGEFKNKAYILNVASHQNGLNYNKNVTHINGFSESSIRFIQEVESGMF